jgi:hypothetical protein
MRKVIAVIGDVIESSHSSNRAALQARLQDSIRRVNARSEPTSPFAISAGDEIEAVYTRGRTLLNDLWFIQAAIYPSRIRFSIGVGEINTPLNRRNPLVMDGPAFHIARKGIGDLKGTGELLRIGAEDEGSVGLENGAARLLSHHMRKWEQNRWNIYTLFVAGEFEQKISLKLDISLTAIYKNIRAGQLQIVKDLSEAISESLAKQVGR